MSEGQACPHAKGSKGQVLSESTQETEPQGLAQGVVTLSLPAAGGAVRESQAHLAVVTSLLNEIGIIE